eukprot:XP_003725538.1 PREDICTED: putative carbonic anhydrase 3 [Strongylocentrotus purpuratus]
MKIPFSVLLLASVLCFGPALAIITKNNWSYAGAGDTDQEFWKDIDGSFCDGSSQSPINIVTKWTREIERAPFNLQSYDTTIDATVENNGHALEIEVSKMPGEGHYDVTGGGLSGTFRAVQFHFHFGSNSMQGSEHTIDGERYPAEMHIVHYDTAYSSVSEAVKNKGGIAVLGFFLEVDDDDNSALDIILDQASNLVRPHTHQEMAGFTLSNLLPSSLDKFWRYDGSLTTPLCNEVVTWTLFEDTIKISNNQLNITRTLMSDAIDEAGYEMPMENNFRDIQSRGIRTIYAVTADDDYGMSPTPTASAGKSAPGAMIVLDAFLVAMALRF